MQLRNVPKLMSRVPTLVSMLRSFIRLFITFPKKHIRMSVVLRIQHYLRVLPSRIIGIMNPAAVWNAT